MIQKISKVLSNDYMFSIAAKIFVILSGVIYSSLFSRYFGPTLRGESAVIINFVSLASVFLGFGMYQTYPIFRKEKKEFPIYFTSNMITVFIAYLAVSIFIIVNFDISTNIKIAALITPLTILIKQINYVVLIERPKKRNINSILIGLTDIIIVIFFIVLFKSNYFFMISFLIVKEILHLIISLVNLEISIFKLKPQFKGIPRFFKFGIIPMITVSLMTINYRVDILMLNGVVLSSSIGIYAIGVNLAELIWLVPNALKDILLSKLTKGSKDSEVAYVIRHSLFFAIISLVGISAFGKYIILILYGTEFLESYNITIIMQIGIIGMIFYKMIYAYNIANGYRVNSLIMLSFAATSNIILNYVMIPIYGIYGAAISSVVSYNMCGIAFLIYFHYKSNIAYKEILFITKKDLKILFDKIR
ncbi:MATE family efflux transporter [Natronincola ferrireducens]|uniref:Membrane protein involved in the export of O-antigen and teichoic acid n=1 Tax=Natronincola ferrireducens TaxID=393762 RepID=A0A1G8X621_9FIRM|nr:polysaccharide biosynthesis C-terminal domain-containing protein [Natronincola ferrireducens]SDJ86099.1 Membrane protein involved in the export of O-antigen and teichoic acid [Natronincola ferrireducens]